MRHVVRGFSGLIAALVGVVGAGFAVLAIVHTWRMHERLDQQVPAAVAQIEILVESVRQQGQATDALLETTRVHLASIRAPILQLAEQNQQLNNTVILQQLDEQIVRKLESVEHFSLSMQNSMRGMSSALLLLDSMPFLGGSMGRRSSSPGQWKEVATNLNDTANLLGQASRTVAGLRSGQDVSPQQMQQLAETLKRIDARLRDVQSHILHFNRTVAQSSQHLEQVNRRAPIWLQRTAITTTVFFVCFGFSQLSLLWQGLRALSPRSVN